MAKVVKIENGLTNKVTVKITKIWKGEDAKEISLTSGDTLCGKDFKKGQEYLFFGQLNEAGLIRSTICDTFEKKNSSKYISWLNRHNK